MKPLIDADIEPYSRTCKKCKRQLRLFLFVKAKQCKYGRTHTCKDCNREIRAPHYKASRKSRSEQENKKNRDRKKTLVEMFHRICHDCGGVFPDCVYDFHHKEPSQKDFKISYFRVLDDRLFSELKKCIMVCSNCHRIRHWDISDKTEGKRGTG